MLFTSPRGRGLASGVTDTADGVRQVVEHLVALGHRSIAYLAGAPQRVDRPRAMACAVRPRGGKRPTAEALRPVLADGRLRGGGSRRRLRHRGHRARRLQRPPRHRHPATPGTAEGGRPRTCQCGRLRRHLRCRLLPSAVDHNEHPAEEAGRTLVDHLLGSPTDRPPSRTVLPTRLLVRESTGPVPDRFVPGPARSGRQPAGRGKPAGSASAGARRAPSPLRAQPGDQRRGELVMPARASSAARMASTGADRPVMSRT